jgi:hypothetical protein
MMAFFEGFIQRFMPYLAELAQLRGSAEKEYTDVHGVCDIAHTQELFQALEVEMTLARDSGEPAKNLLEGVDLLRALIQKITAATSRAPAGIRDQTMAISGGLNVGESRCDFADSAD